MIEVRLSIEDKQLFILSLLLKLTLIHPFDVLPSPNTKCTYALDEYFTSKDYSCDSCNDNVCLNCVVTDNRMDLDVKNVGRLLVALLVHEVSVCKHLDLRQRQKQR